MFIQVMSLMYLSSFLTQYCSKIRDKIWSIDVEGIKIKILNRKIFDCAGFRPEIF